MASIWKKLFSKDELDSFADISTFFWHINWLKTFYINLRALPLKQAIKLPILVAWNTKIINIGKIIISRNLHTGMLSIGVKKIVAWETNDEKTIFNNNGTVIIGGKVKLHSGVKFILLHGATISVGNHVGFGANTKVICYKSITIGDDFRCSWNSQLFDTDFHFLHNITEQKYYPRTKPIKIGNDVFVGNGSTIAKGTIIPNGCVISCISKVSGDFTKHGEHLLISGNPATVVKTGIGITNGWYLREEYEVALKVESTI